MNETPSAALIVLNWNGRSLLETCLPALSRVDYPHYRIIVVDNASDDDSIAYVRQKFPDVITLVNAENLGFGAGMNVGLRYALDEGYEILVSVNNDVIVRPDWLTHLIRPFTQDEAVGIVGCKLLYPDEKTIQHAGAELTYPLAYSHHYYHREEDRGQADEAQEVAYVTGASMAIRREALAQAGLFDELFAPFYYEEVDLCYRMRAAGYRVLYMPAAVAIHHESASMQKASVSPLRMPVFHLNRLKFIFKHYTLDQILNDFVPAERERLDATEKALELRIIQRVYLQATAELGQIPLTPQTAQKIEAVLRELTRYAQRTQWERYGYQSKTWPMQALHERHKIEEFQFRSATPVVGPLVAAFREQWNSISTKWYVRGMFGQQEAFNATATQIIHQLADSLELLAQSYAGQEDAHLDSFNLLAGEIARLGLRLQAQSDELRAEIARLDRRLDRIEALLDARQNADNLD